VKLLQVPKRLLLPIISILCVVGSYALRNTFFDTGTMLFFGILGYFMNKYNFPILPMLLAIILGPALEEHMRMSLIISQGDPSIFITHPISLTFILIAVVSFTLPLIRRRAKVT
jgi:putative tricarboxylic transport membrane protein